MGKKPNPLLSDYFPIRPRCNLTPEAGINQVQQELKNLVQKCNLASMSTRKTLNEEKNPLIPVRSFIKEVEYNVPTGPTAPLTRRNNVIKKASETLHEHRKDIETYREDIETCVSAILLLHQQHADPGQSPSTPSSEPHSEEEKNEQVEYHVRTEPTSPLPCRYSLIKNASKTFSECHKEIKECIPAARLLQQQRADPNQSWSATSSLDSEEEHSSAASAASLSSLCQFSEPVSRRPVNSSSSNRMGQVRAYWNSMTADRQLSLLRASIPELKSHYASLKEMAMLDLLSEALSFAEESGSWEFWICSKCSEIFSDAVSHLNHVRAHIRMMSDLAMEAIPEEVNSDWVGMLTNISLKPIDVEYVIRSSDEDNNRNSNLLNDTDSDNSDYASPFNCLERVVKEDGDCNGFEKMESVVNSMHDAGGRLNSWPLADDPEREKLLEKIQSMFYSMIKHRCLSTRHVRKLLEFANDQIKTYPLPSSVLVGCSEELERTPLGLCFLDASKLQAVLTFLQELPHTGGLRRSLEKDASAGDADCDRNNGIDLETVKLDIKSSTLCIEGGEVERGLRDANALLKWIYTGPSIADMLLTWVSDMVVKSNQVMELVHTLEKELSLCQTLCDRKLEYLLTLKLLELLENLREEKGLGFEEFLKKRYDELTERQGEELLTGCSQDELDLIRSLVKESYEQFKVSNSVYEHGIGSRLQDIDAGNVYECAIQDFEPAGDALISYVLSRKKDNLNAELNKLDVLIMQRVTEMRLVELKLGRASLFDYRFVLIPLIKSFVRTRLEELVDKDAKDRFVAAKEAFWAAQPAVTKDAKKISLKGELKQLNQKSKDKKKGRDYRKSESPKVVNLYSDFDILDLNLPGNEMA